MRCAPATLKFLAHQVLAQAPNSGPGVDDDPGAALRAHLHARSITPVALRLGTRNRQRAADSPEADPHAVRDARRPSRCAPPRRQSIVSNITQQGGGWLPLAFGLAPHLALRVSRTPPRCRSLPHLAAAAPAPPCRGLPAPHLAAAPSRTPPRCRSRLPAPHLAAAAKPPSLAAAIARKSLHRATILEGSRSGSVAPSPRGPFFDYPLGPFLSPLGLPEVFLGLRFPRWARVIRRLAQSAAPMQAVSVLKPCRRGGRRWSPGFGRAVWTRGTKPPRH